jgi:hypothetical protein
MIRNDKNGISPAFDKNKLSNFFNLNLNLIGNSYWILVVLPFFVYQNAVLKGAIRRRKSKMTDNGVTKRNRTNNNVQNTMQKTKH